MKLSQFSIMAALAAAFTLTAIAPAVAANNVVVTNEAILGVRVMITAHQLVNNRVVQFSTYLESIRERNGDHAIGVVMPIGEFNIFAAIPDPKTRLGVSGLPPICTVRQDFHLGSMEQLRFAVRLVGKTCVLQAI